MIAALTGSTGFIGSSLFLSLGAAGWTMRPVPRDAFGLNEEELLLKKIEGVDGVIHLAGSPVAGKWNEQVKQEIRDSRVLTTRKLVEAIKKAEKKPRFFISASAVGIYDSQGRHDETSRAFSSGFLGQVCREWEQEAAGATDQCRTVILRLGVVLGKEGGALQRMYRPFSIGLGGKIGRGDQYISFLHMTDLANIIRFIADHPELDGVINAVTPFPVTNYEFTDKLAKVLNQPAWLTIPSFFLKMLYGEGASVLLEGQQVIPGKLEKAGFRFRYPSLQNCLMEIYR